MRMKSELWVKAYLRARGGQNVMAVLTRRGDPDAGAIFLVIDILDGRCHLYGPAPAGLDVVDRERRWEACFSDGLVDRLRAMEYLNRQAEMDGDIWVIEVEDGDGRHFLDEELVRD